MFQLGGAGGCDWMQNWFSAASSKIWYKNWRSSRHLRLGASCCVHKNICCLFNDLLQNEQFNKTAEANLSISQVTNARVAGKKKHKIMLFFKPLSSVNVVTHFADCTVCPGHAGPVCEDSDGVLSEESEWNYRGQRSHHGCAVLAAQWYLAGAFLVVDWWVARQVVCVDCFRTLCS